MDWHIVAALVAGVLQVVSIGLYIKEMLYGTARPNVVSWSLWGFSTSILLAAQLNAGPTWSLVLPIVTTGIEWCVVWLAFFGYGYKKFGVIDAACLLLSLAALYLWYVTSDPVIAILFAVASDGVAYLPTFVKTVREPFSEAAFPWLLSALVGLFSILASSRADIANLAFPAYYLGINLVLWVLIVAGQRLKKA